METASSRSVLIWTKPLPSRTRRRRNRRQTSLSSWYQSAAALPLAKQIGDASNGEGDADLQRTEVYQD